MLIKLYQDGKMCAELTFGSLGNQRNDFKLSDQNKKVLHRQRLFLSAIVDLHRGSRRRVRQTIYAFDTIYHDLKYAIRYKHKNKKIGVMRAWYTKCAKPTLTFDTNRVNRVRVCFISHKRSKNPRSPSESALSKRKPKEGEIDQYY
uniref:Uncharacterized protein n=1 Tax=Photinus pyralis TaxID=7054 RepID=A0A1Y1ML82_PHOPY